MQNSARKLLKCISNQSEIFLKDDMTVDIIESHPIDTAILETHLACIDLTNKHTYTIIISIENTLFTTLFEIFFSEGVDSSEKKELEDALPEEIVNTVVGLAIKDFPEECAHLELGIPYQLTQKELSTLRDKTRNQNFQILTCKGNFYCSIFKQ